MKNSRTGLRAPFSWLAGLLALAAVGLLALAPSASAAPSTAVAGTLTWGVIESFRTYVAGPVAQGTITTSDGAVTNTSGLFEFPLTSGTYDASTGAVLVSFGGQVKFEGHTTAAGPQLSVTISNLRLALDGANGSLVANIASKNMTTGELVQYANVTLAELSGAAAAGSGTPVTWTGIAATLTAGAAPAFGGMYNAGQAMDAATLLLIVPPSGPTGSPTAPPTTTTPVSGAAPTLQLSKVVVNPDGDTITVTGSGFLPSMATGTRPPLAGKPAGVYIAFGAFADNWKPSAGAPSSARPSLPQADGGIRWAVLEGDRAIIGMQDSVTLNPDGSFVATVTVQRGYDGALPDGNYGIYTYPGSGAIQPAFETFTAITFTDDVPSPTATATVIAPQPPATGTGMAPGDSTHLTLIIAAAVVLGAGAIGTVVGGSVLSARKNR